MGATASIRQDVERELKKPMDGSDCGFNGRMEVVKLRRMLHSVDPQRLHQLLAAELPYDLLRYADIPESMLDPSLAENQDEEWDSDDSDAPANGGERKCTDAEAEEPALDEDGKPVPVEKKKKRKRKKDASYPKPFVQVLMRDFVAWLESPGGWAMRSLLCENRKASHLAGLDLDESTASSNGMLPWRFGPPMTQTASGGAEGEEGFIEALNAMLLPQHQLEFVRRYSDLTQRSDTANFYEVVFGDGYDGVPKFKAVYSCIAITGPSDRNAVLDEARIRIPRDITNGQSHKERRHFLNCFMGGAGHDAISEHPGVGGTVYEALLRPGFLPAPGSKLRLKWARRCAAAMIESVKCMHEHEHTHGDLRPETFVIIPSDENTFNVGFGGMEKYKREIEAEGAAEAARTARAASVVAADGSGAPPAAAEEAAAEANEEEDGAVDAQDGSGETASVEDEGAAKAGDPRKVDAHFTVRIMAHTAQFDEPRMASIHRRKLYDNICLSYVIAMCYVDLAAWCETEKVAAHTAGRELRWDEDVTPALLRELMAAYPEWWGEDVEFIKAALLFDDGPLRKASANSPRGGKRAASSVPASPTSPRSPKRDDAGEQGPETAAVESTSDARKGADPATPHVKVAPQFAESVFETQGPFDFCDGFREEENWDAGAVLVKKEKNVRASPVAKASETGEAEATTAAVAEEEARSSPKRRGDEQDEPQFAALEGEWPGSMVCSVLRRNIFDWENGVDDLQVKRFVKRQTKTFKQMVTSGTTVIASEYHWKEYFIW